MTSYSVVTSLMGTTYPDLFELKPDWCVRNWLTSRCGTRKRTEVAQSSEKEKIMPKHHDHHFELDWELATFLYFHLYLKRRDLVIRSRYVPQILDFDFKSHIFQEIWFFIPILHNWINYQPLNVITFQMSYLLKIAK